MPKRLLRIEFQELLAALAIAGLLSGWFYANFTKLDDFNKFRCNVLRRDMFILASRSRQLKSHIESNMVGYNSIDPLQYSEFLALEIQQIENNIDELQYKIKDLNC